MLKTAGSSLRLQEEALPSDDESSSQKKETQSSSSTHDGGPNKPHNRAIENACHRVLEDAADGVSDMNTRLKQLLDQYIRTMISATAAWERLSSDKERERHKILNEQIKQLEVILHEFYQTYYEFHGSPRNEQSTD